MKPVFFLTLIFFVVLSCGSDDDTSDNDFQSTEIIPIEIGKDAIYGNGEEGVSQSSLVINDETDWQNLLQQVNTVNNVSDNFSETDIDFSTYTVLAIFLDIKENGWEVEINNIVENEDTITVTTEELEFDNSVITQPFHIVKIPITDKEIVFE